MKKKSQRKIGFLKIDFLNTTPVKVTSQYLTMGDGTRIAIDVWLPRDRDRADAAYPVIVRQTRYFRSVQLRRPFRWLMGGRPFDHTGLYAKRRNRFLENGYGWVDVDVRGSGASSGYRTAPWSQPEVSEAMAIVRWIGDQPWCNGQIGSLGISYDGTAAEWLLCHPESSAEEFPVIAVAPRFSSCDAFADIGFPGGLKNEGFSNRWHRTNAALDRNRLSDLVGWPVKLITGGVTPVDGDHGGKQRDQAVVDHAENYDVLERMGRIEFTDDEAVDQREEVQPRWAQDGTLLNGSSLISPLHYTDQINASKIPIFSYSGWWDGGYAKVAALRFLRSPNPGSRLILGPWNHGGGWNVDARSGGINSVKEPFDHDGTLIDFFDQSRHRRDGKTSVGDASTVDQRNEGQDFQPVVYYTMGDHQTPRWNHSTSWPPPHVEIHKFQFTSDHRILPRVGGRESQNSPPFQMEYRRSATTTGKTNRWQTQAQPDAPVKYSDRRKDVDLRLNFRSAPLEHSITVTGHPVVDLSVASDAGDASLFVYLEEVTPGGTIRMVTEGLLSLRHRKIIPPTERPSSIADACERCGIPNRSYRREDALPMPIVSDDEPKPGDFQRVVLDLLPVSYRFGAGSRYQISIALADEGNFVLPTSEEETTKSGTAAHTIWLQQDHHRALTLRLPIETSPV